VVAGFLGWLRALQAPRAAIVRRSESALRGSGQLVRTTCDSRETCTRVSPAITGTLSLISASATGAACTACHA
jgi:hypothetical protein